METLSHEQELDALYALCSLPIRGDTPGQVGALAVEQAVNLLGCQLAIFYQHHSIDATLTPLAAQGIKLQSLSVLSLPGEGTQFLTVPQLRTWEGVEAATLLKAVSGKESTSVAATIPVLSAGILAGVLVVARSHPLSAGELRLADLLAQRLSAAWIGMQLPTLRRAKALYTISHVLSEHTTVKAVLQAAVDGTREGLNADVVFINSINVTHNTIEHMVSAGGTVPEPYQVLSVEDMWAGWSGEVLRSLKPVSVSGKALLDAHEDVGALIIAPLLARGEVLGTLTAMKMLHSLDFEEADVDLAAAIAKQTAIAMMNARLFEQSQQQIAELSTLNQISVFVSSGATLEDILTRVDEQVNKLFDTTNFYVAVYEQGSEEWTFAWHIVRGERQLLQRHSIHQGLTGHIIRTREPVFLPNLAANRVFLEAHGMPLMGEQAKSWMGVPLVSGDEVVGAMAVENYDYEDVFVEKDLLLFSTISLQVANAIKTAQLFEETRRRAGQLQMAAEVSRAASSLLEVDELLPMVVNLIQERMQIYYSGIFLLDSTGQWAVLRAGTGEAGERMLARGHKLAVGSDSMIGACVAEGRARILLDVDLSEEQRIVRQRNPDLPETRSEMALPLMARGETIGAMTIQDTRQAAFAEEDITVLQTLADQLANAIANANLFSDSQQRLNELQMLQRQYTAESWGEYASRQAVLGYAYDLSRVAPLDVPVTLESLPPAALEQGQVVALSGQQNQELGARLFAPVLLQGEPIGMLGFEDMEAARVWSEDDIALIEAVRDQLGLALQNRLLFAQTQEALRETGALYEIGVHINEAHTIEEVLIAAADGIMQRPEPNRVAVGLLEPLKQPENFRIVASQDRSATDVHNSKTYPLEYWGNLLDVLTQERRFVTSDVEADPSFSELLLSVYRQIGVRGMVALPLNVQQLRYGLVLIYTSEPHNFTAEELRFYETVVQQSSVALENLYLFETTQAEAERRAILNEVLQSASRSLNPAEMMRDVGEVIAQRFQMPTMLWRWNGEKIALVAAYRADGMEASFAMDAVFALGDMPGVGSAIVTQDAILISSLSKSDMHPQIRDMVGYLGLEELFAVPLLSREKVLGVLLLGRQRNHPAIDENEMAFLRLAGINVSVALENARLYQDAQETAEQLREVDRLKSEFLANMSHELRTPLNSIIGFSRVILKGIDGPVTDMQRTDLQAIYDSGQHLLGLINDILDLSKVEAGKMDFHFEPTDVYDIVRGVMSTAIALVKDKSVDLQQALPENLPLIMVDARRIRQVLLNLVNNATKFTEEGFVRVAVSVEDRFVTFAVQDSGIGIPESSLLDIFEPFTQVDTSSTRRYQGTGLGLPISREFVKAHGGRIWVESRLGYGSTFFFMLPIAGPNAPAEAPESEVELDGERIVLVIDDDESVVTLFRRYLGKQGYQVAGVTKGQSAVDEAARLQPFAITLDIMMPDKDGWQVIQELKSRAETRDIPIVVCSILSEADKGLSMGVADYLVKPILEQDLLHALARLDPTAPSYVLVVDDNADDRKLLRRILEDEKYVVEECASGVEAIAHIHTTLPGLVVLDLMMPEVDGFAVIENLKSQERTRNIPIVVVTAKELTVEEREALQQRVQALLQKGLFNQERLLQDVARALEQLKASE